MKQIRMIGLLWAAVLCCSCGGKEHEDRKIFHYNQSSGLETTDPAFARSQAIMWVAHQFYNTLLEVDADMNLRPSLAKSWEISPDKKDIVFHLRDDVYFHPDPCFDDQPRKLKASDVVYSYARIIDPSTASNGAWIFNGRVDSLLPFQALDDSTFVLHLRQAYQPILYILTMQYCSIVPEEAVERYGVDFRNHPVGTGPFRLEDWEEGIGMTMVKNKNYWERDSMGKSLPYIDGVSVSFVDNKASEFLLFKQGKLDFMNSLDPSFKDAALYKNGSLKQQDFPNSVLYKTAYLNTEYFGFLLDESKADFQDAVSSRRFRQAVNFAVNRAGLIQYMRNGIGLPAENGIIPPSLPGYDSTQIGYRYDPSKAKQLLDQCRADGMTDFSLILSCPDIYLDYAQYVIDNLEEVGIKAKIDVVHQSLLREKMIKSQCGFFRASWIADYPDAESYLTLYYGPNPAPPNYTRYRNPHYDQLYEIALQEPDGQKRKQLYAELNTIIMEDAPMLFLFYDEVTHFVRKRIEGWQVNALNLLELRYVDWKKPSH